VFIDSWVAYPMGGLCQPSVSILAVREVAGRISWWFEYLAKLVEDLGWEGRRGGGEWMKGRWREGGQNVNKLRNCISEHFEKGIR
jgi:hypothetical protein